MTNLLNCRFSSNVSGGHGGAVWISKVTTKVADCSFDHNYCGSGGGAIYSNKCPRLFNCSFGQNWSVASASGGACQFDSTTAVVKNCIFWGNWDGSASFAQASQIYLPSSTLTINYSCLQGWTGSLGGTGNHGNDPQFVDLAAGDLHVQLGSPCVEAGDNSVIVTGEKDLDTRERIVDVDHDDNPVVDMGAYELRVWYVDANRTIGNDDGRSWEDAFHTVDELYRGPVSRSFVNGTLQTGDQIWVADGTYFPTHDSDRTMSFVLPKGVKVFGGFHGATGGTGETAFAQRNVTVNKTILSGDINTSVATDNSYHVVTGAGDAETLLDGFYITGGHANGSSQSQNGGGVYISGASPSVRNCFLAGNYAEQDGGGLYVASGAPRALNCVFTGNSAGGNGGGVASNAASPSMINCTFSGNAAATGGGHAESGSAHAAISNSILWGNSATTSANISGSPVVTCSDVQSGFSGTGNINSDPLFVDAAGADNVIGTLDDDLQIAGSSPCVDAGNNPKIQNSLSLALDGANRIIDGNADSTATVDMGAYEYNLHAVNTAIDPLDATYMIDLVFNGPVTVATNVTSDARIQAEIGQYGQTPEWYDCLFAVAEADTPSSGQTTVHLTFDHPECFSQMTGWRITGTPSILVPGSGYAFHPVSGPVIPKQTVAHAAFSAQWGELILITDEPIFDMTDYGETDGLTYSIDSSEWNTNGLDVFLPEAGLIPFLPNENAEAILGAECDLTTPMTQTLYSPATGHTVAANADTATPYGLVYAVSINPNNIGATKAGWFFSYPIHDPDINENQPDQVTGLQLFINGAWRSGVWSSWYNSNYRYPVIDYCPFSIPTDSYVPWRITSASATLILGEDDYDYNIFCYPYVGQHGVAVTSYFPFFSCGPSLFAQQNTMRGQSESMSRPLSILDRIAALIGE